jgi:hypothetical protein
MPIRQRRFKAIANEDEIGVSDASHKQLLGEVAGSSDRPINRLAACCKCNWLPMFRTGLAPKKWFDVRPAV